MPHPLPANVGSVQGMRYFLVALPDDSAFLQAALAIYSKLENAYMWGLEGEINPDSEDAAQLWAASVAETVRLIQMGWPDDVLNAIDEIESILSALQRITGCCPDEDISDGDLFTDVVEEGVGDVPPNIVSAGYASSSGDWAGFATYKCMIAHVVVDDLAGKLRKLAPLVDDAGLVIGGIGAIAAIISTILTGGGFAIAIGILGGLGAVAGLYAKISEGGILLDLADKVDANHDDLACAFMLGDGAESSITAMYAEIDNLFTALEEPILKNLNSRPVAKALYAGRYEQENIAQRLADNGYVASSYNCDCLETEFQYDWTTSLQGWPSGTEIQLTFLNPNISVVSNTDSGETWKEASGAPTGNQLTAELGLSAVPTISGGFARFMFSAGSGSPIDQRIRFRIVVAGGTSYLSPEYRADVLGTGVWIEVSWPLGVTAQLAATVTCVNIGVLRTESAANGQKCIVDYFGGYA